MPRKPRILKDDGIYHIIARGNNRRYLFAIQGGFHFFKSLIKESKEQYLFKLYHYCLMTNHVHLLIQVHKGLTLPKIMQCILHGYTRWYKKQTGYTGHLWEGRYKSPIIEKESYLLECGRYIERNPIRSQLCQSLNDYSHSSYHFYSKGKQDPLVDPSFFYNELGDSLQEKQKNYKAFVKLDGPYDRQIDREVVVQHF